MIRDRRTTRATYREIFIEGARLNLGPDTGVKKADEARRVLEQHLGDFMDTPDPTPPRAPRRTPAVLLIGLLIGVGSTYAWYDTSTRLTPAPTATPPAVSVQPHLSPIPVPPTLAQLPIGAPSDPEVDALVRAALNKFLAELEAAPSPTPEPTTPAPVQTPKPTNTPKPTTPAPAPIETTTAPAAPYFTGLNGYAISGTGSLTINATIKTSGDMAVTITASAGGQTITLASSVPVNGQATFEGTISGLTAGTHTVVVTATSPDAAPLSFSSPANVY